MAQQHTHDPDRDADELQSELRAQLPSEWGVRVHHYPADDSLTVSLHHRENAHITVREATTGGYLVRARSPGMAAHRRLLHPENDDGPLALQRCLDRAVVKAYQYANNGSLFLDD